MTETPTEPVMTYEREPLISKRELLTQLAIVTLGVLIALSFEGLREWRNERALVAAAHRNLANEIRDNRIEIEKMPEAYARFRAQLDAGTAAAQDLLEGRPGPNEMNLSFEFAELGKSSYSTASLTGAFALMPYEDVKRYEAIYELQRQFSETEAQAFQNFLSVISSIRLVANPARATPDELRAWNAQIHFVRSTIDVLEQIAKRLSDAYAERLPD